MLSEKAWRRREKREKRRSISRLKTKKKKGKEPTLLWQRKCMCSSSCIRKTIKRSKNEPFPSSLYLCSLLNSKSKNLVFAYCYVFFFFFCRYDQLAHVALHGLLSFFLRFCGPSPHQPTSQCTSPFSGDTSTDVVA